MLATVLLNLVLIVQERLPNPDARPEVTKIDEPLRHLLYRPTERRNNFKKMGMDDEFAHRVANRIDKYTSMKAKFVAMLQDQAADVGDAFCPTAGLPQPYAAARFLITEENNRRDIVDASRLTRFDSQPWFDKSPVMGVYSELEAVEGRREDATLLGVAALLLAREADALAGRSPWSRGLIRRGSFSTLERQEPRITVLVMDYFALMHYLTELANTSDGICS